MTSPSTVSKSEASESADDFFAAGIQRSDFLKLTKLTVSYPHPDSGTQKSLDRLITRPNVALAVRQIFLLLFNTRDSPFISVEVKDAVLAPTPCKISQDM